MTRVQIAIFLKVNDITQAIFRSNFGVTNEGVLLFSWASDTRLNDFNSVSPIWSFGSQPVYEERWILAVNLCKKYRTESP